MRAGQLHPTRKWHYAQGRCSLKQQAYCKVSSSPQQTPAGCWQREQPYSGMPSVHQSMPSSHVQRAVVTLQRRAVQVPWLRAHLSWTCPPHGGEPCSACLRPASPCSARPRGAECQHSSEPEAGASAPGRCRSVLCSLHGETILRDQTHPALMRMTHAGTTPTLVKTAAPCEAEERYLAVRSWDSGILYNVCVHNTV